MVGTSYQLGNLVSSASSTIEATIGERFPLPPLIKNGKKTPRYEYGKVICIFMACVYVYVILLTFLGPEHKNRGMSVADDQDMAEAAGKDRIAAATHAPVHHDKSSDDEIEKV